MPASRAVFSAPIATVADSLPASLAQLQDELWTHICNALDGRWLPWSLPVLVTVTPDGAPRPRVLALRAADRAARIFTFHTDARSLKVSDLRSNSRASLLFFDRDDAIQARFDGTAVVHRVDAHAKTAWANVSPLRAHASAVALAPGTPLSSSQRFDDLALLSEPTQTIENFAVVEIEVDAIDWLWLGPHDLRRARFTWTGRDWSGAWVAP